MSLTYWRCPKCGAVDQFHINRIVFLRRAPVCSNCYSDDDPCSLEYIQVVSPGEMRQHLIDYIDRLDPKSFIKLYRQCFPQRDPKRVEDYGYEI
jgi:hypothetical protein